MTNPKETLFLGLFSAEEKRGGCGEDPGIGSSPEFQTTRKVEGKKISFYYICNEIAAFLSVFKSRDQVMPGSFPSRLIFGGEKPWERDWPQGEIAARNSPHVWFSRGSLTFSCDLIFAPPPSPHKTSSKERP